MVSGKPAGATCKTCFLRQILSHGGEFYGKHGRHTVEVNQVIPVYWVYSPRILNIGLSFSVPGWVTGLLMDIGLGGVFWMTVGVFCFGSVRIADGAC